MNGLTGFVVVLFIVLVHSEYVVLGLVQNEGEIRVLPGQKITCIPAVGYPVEN